jgi:hypothetical protein
MQVFALRSHEVKNNTVTINLINDEGFEKQTLVFDTPEEATLKNAVLAYEDHTGNLVHVKL